jgi:mannose-6-phosphate isomerase-like protein (cupin superfamily)
VEIGDMAMLWEEIIAMMSDSLTGGKDTQQQISSEGAKMHASDPIKFVPKGWGYEKWLVNCEDYCGKILFFAKGRKCSWHYHLLKDEVFYIQKGAIEVIYSYQDNPEIADKIILVEGDKFHVPKGLRHQMFALKDTELFEFSTTHFDTDSIRIEKGD